jgi:hypothetical protein
MADDVDDVCGRHERIRDRAQVGYRHRGAQLTVDLGEEERLGGHGRAVERGQPPHRGDVIRIRGPDLYMRAKGLVHVVRVPFPAYNFK